MLQHWLKDPYFAQPAPKSTGRETFNATWINAGLAAYPDNAANVQRTLCELSAHSIAQSITQQKNYKASDSIIICGGGAHNNFLIQQLAKDIPNQISTGDELGISNDFCEAMGFAWLAQQHIENKKFDLQKITGAKGLVQLGVRY